MLSLFTRNKKNQHLCFKIKTWKVKGRYEIMNGISENFTLVQFMYTVGDVNHAESIVVICTFD